MKRGPLDTYLGNLYKRLPEPQLGYQVKCSPEAYLNDLLDGFNVSSCRALCSPNFSDIDFEDENGNLPLKPYECELYAAASGKIAWLSIVRTNSALPLRILLCIASRPLKPL